MIRPPRSVRAMMWGVVLIAGVPDARSASPAGAARHGFEVYAQVCSACHGMTRVRFADLAGLGIDADTIAAFARRHQIPDGLDDDGDPRTRAAGPTDPITAPFPSDALARAANHGVVPPDFSRLAMTRAGGAARIDRLLLSYGPTPPGIQIPPGLFYNASTHRPAIAMPPPLHDGQVTYPDGSHPDVAQAAADVSAFLDWVAHPHRAERRRTGWFVLAYLLLMTILCLALTRMIWRPDTR